MIRTTALPTVYYVEQTKHYVDAGLKPHYFVILVMVYSQKIKTCLKCDTFSRASAFQYGLQMNSGRLDRVLARQFTCQGTLSSSAIEYDQPPIVPKQITISVCGRSLARRKALHHGGRITPATKTT